MKYVKRISLITVILFLLMEIIFRVFMGSELRKWKNPNYKKDKILGYTYLPNSNGVKSNYAFKNKYSINSEGFNWNEFSKKERDVFRVMLVGTSNMTGIETNGPRNFIKLMQEESLNRGNKIEFINCAIDGGYRSLKNLRLIEDSYKRYKPDLVLLELDFPLSDQCLYRHSYKGYKISFESYENDLKLEKEFIEENFLSPTLFNLSFDYSYAVRYLCRFVVNRKEKLLNKQNNYWGKKILINRMPIIEGYSRGVLRAFNAKNNFKKLKPYYLSAKKSIDRITKLKMKLKKEGIDFAYVKFFSNENDVLINYLLRKKNIKFINLDIREKESYSFGDLDGHLNQNGHKVVADKLYNVLINNEIIPLEFISKNNVTISQLKKKEESSNLNLFDLSIGNYNHLKKNGDFNVLYFFNKECSSEFIKYISDFLSINYSLVDYKVVKYDSIHTMENFIKKLDKKLIDRRYDLVISDLKSNFFKESIRRKTFGLLKEYNMHLKRNQIDVLFFNYDFNDRDALTLDPIFECEDISFSNPNIIFNNWELKNYSRSYCLNLRDQLCSEYIFKDVKTKYLNTKHIKRYNNLARKSEVFVSSSLETKGWSKRYINDGHHFFTRLNKGLKTKKKAKIESGNEWIIFKLDSLKVLHKIVIYPRNNKRNNWVGLPDYLNVSVSNDSLKWRKIKEIGKIKKAVNNDIFLSFSLAGENAKYVKLEGVKLENKILPPIQLMEVEIYGTNLN